MKLRVLSDAESVARSGAAFIAEAAHAAIKDRNKFIFAVSGGRTPWVMLRALASEPLPWDSIHIVQVDERVAPADDPDRNLAHLRESLLSNAPLPPDNIHAMPVEQDDLAAASAEYGRTLEALAGTPPVLDLVHLGLGPDGHTASLVPGDPVLEVSDAPVGTTGAYQGRNRMTLTYPVLNHARSVMFIVTGAEKVDALSRLVKHDPTIPAGRVRPDNATVIADESAAVGVDHD
ncbi:MAG: 6-phosphogluconolactonase [Methyloligellaceae bacterium]